MSHQPTSFKALYTKHKTQKSKKWMDGFVKVVGSKVVIYDENRKQIDSVFLKAPPGGAGAEFESELFLVQIEEEESTNSNGALTPNAATAPPPPAPNLSRRVFSPFKNPMRPKPAPPSLSPPPGVSVADDDDHAPPRFNFAAPSRILEEPTEMITVTPAKPGGRSDEELLAMLAQRVSAPPRARSPLPKPMERGSSREGEAPPEHSIPFRVGGESVRLQASAVHDESARNIASENDKANVFGTRLDSISISSMIRSAKQQQRPRTSNDGESLARHDSSLFSLLANDVEKPAQAAPFILPLSKPLGRAAAAANNPSSSGQSLSAEVTRPFKAPAMNAPWKKISKWDHTQLCFPNQEAIDTVSKLEANGSKRQIILPERFESLADYQRLMRSAIIEDLNLRLLQLAVALRRSLATIAQMRNRNSHDGGGVAKTCTHGVPAKYGVVKKDGNNKGRPFYSCGNRNDRCNFFEWADSLSVTGGQQQQPTPAVIRIQGISKNEEQIFRANGVPLYVEAKIVVGGEHLAGKFTRNRFDRDRSAAPPKFTFLQIENREHSSAYGKDDIWIICTNPCFEIRNSDDKLFIASSVYHGPTRIGMIQIKPFDPALRIPDGTGVYAIRGPNANSEVGMLECLEKLSFTTTPVMSAVLKGASAGVPMQQRNALSVNAQSTVLPLGAVPTSRVIELADATTTKYHLNEDQATVLKRVVKWWTEGNAVSPVILVHGVFGSGKSHLLVVLVIFLSKLLDEADDADTKILIAAATNTAVDRVLLGLLALGYSDFLRVGSLRKIAKPVMSHMLDTSSQTERIKELRKMLKADELSAAERQFVKAELDSQKAGRHKQREESLKTIRTVGVTCAASTFPIMKEAKFRIVFLDESSQMVEPASLLPMAFGCSHLLCVGDPLQLPPTLTNYVETLTANDLGRTLFSRLARAGIDPVLLRTQYRCHPVFSGVVNRLFYGSKLLNGVTETDRGPLVEGLPALVFCNSDQGREEVQLQSNSYSNEFEAKLVVQFIRMLIDSGVPPNDIGVIALYRAQVSKVSELLVQAYPKVEKKKAKRSSRKRKSEEKEEERELPEVLGEQAEEVDEEAAEAEAEEEDEEEEVLAAEPVGNEAIDGDVDPLEIQISTVDAFQGAEKAVIIVTCSRTSKFTGFIDSPKRLNVALTRAKNHLIIIGRQNVLCAAEGTWREIYRTAQQVPAGIQQGSTILRLESLEDLPTAAGSHVSAAPALPKRKAEDITLEELEQYEAVLAEENENVRAASSTPALISPLAAPIGNANAKHAPAALSDSDLEAAVPSFDMQVES